MRFEVAGFTSPCVGETRSGDLFVVRGDAERTMMVVVDVLGHGARAADVADQARAFLLQAPITTAEAQIELLHRELRGTRGAAALAVSVEHTGRLEGCGVGNVAMRAVGMRVPAMLSDGILGQRVRKLRPFSVDLQPGRMLLFTDGISSRFLGTEEERLGEVDVAARAILSQYAHAHDDATILVVDVVDETHSGEVVTLHDSAVLDRTFGRK